MRLAEFARVLAEIMVDDPTEEPAYAKWLVATTWKTPYCPIV